MTTRIAHRTASLLAAALLVAVPRAARAQPSRAEEWPARLSAAARGELAAIADSARAAGAPTGPLYGKAAEGVLKRAEDARIVAAVRRLAAELRGAREALGPAAAESEVAAAASALRVGVTRDALRQLARARTDTRPEARGEASLLLPISALAELVGGGVSPEVAMRAVTAFVARGGAPGELEGLLRPVAMPGEDQAARARDLLRALDGRERRP